MKSILKVQENSNDGDSDGPEEVSIKHTLEANELPIKRKRTRHKKSDVKITDQLINDFALIPDSMDFLPKPTKVQINYQENSKKPKIIDNFEIITSDKKADNRINRLFKSKTKTAIKPSEIPESISALKFIMNKRGCLRSSK